MPVAAHGMIYVETAGDVASLIESVRNASVVAFDTEFMWERTYWPKVCLLQLAFDGEAAIADPLAVDLTGLWEAIADAPLVVVHAGEADLGIMHRAVGRLPGEVFDTQVAAAFLGHGESAGYGRLVEAALGSRVRGGEGYSDWTQRPLHPDQLDYAIEDVRHLLDLREELCADLEKRERSAWAVEETRRRLARIGTPAEPEEMWRRVKGANRLRGRALAVLREIAAWREREAMHRDEARQRIVPDRVLIEIARRGPTEAGAIAGIRGLHPGRARAVAEPLAAAVRRVGDLPESEYPRWPPRPLRAGDPIIEAVGSVLHGVVRMRARELDLATSLLATRSDLDELVRCRLAGEADQGALMAGWRHSAVGADVARILDGTAAIEVVLGGDAPGLVIG